MKRYNKIHVKHYKKFFLTEGKKQAIQILQNEYGRDAKMIVNELEALDPTSPKNKYIELFAKLFKKYAKSSRDGNIKTKIRSFINYLDDQDIRAKIQTLENKNQKIDVSRIKDIEEFVDVINRLSSKITKGTAKKGLAGLKEGKDYLTVLKNDQIEAYIPLHYAASKVIASDRVGYCEGEWCTAYQKTDEYWEEYVIDNLGILVYIILVDPDWENYDPEDWKNAVYFYNPSFYEIFDAKDKSINTTFEFNKIKSYVSKNWDKIRSYFPEPEPEPEPEHWIEKATINTNAKYDIENNYVKWYSGTWYDGVWKDGTWEGGTWYNGTWEFGLWKGGLWNYGTWYDGFWKDGTWYDGLWKNGTWESGTWESGTWEGGTWEGGLWKDGIWYDGLWKNGTWQRGAWESGTWRDGTWEGGTWESGLWRGGTWYDGTWEGGTWYDGLWKGGLWNYGTWRDGFWKDGTWYDGVWKGGTWEKGRIYSSKYSIIVESLVNPKDFVKIEATSNSLAELEDKVQK